jgi:aryl-alcohol dehydrogenase-like predicted oxidoreductase
MQANTNSEFDQPVFSKICFGCEPLGGVDWGEVNLNDIETAIHSALDNGIDFFDTAASYGLGLSESRLSEILGEKRHHLLLATKGGLKWGTPEFSGRANVIKDSSITSLRAGVEGSLRRLRIDQIPLFYIHWPDSSCDLRDTFDFLMNLRHEGKIRYIGCSNFNANELQVACSVAEVSVLQVPINMLSPPISSEMESVVTKNRVQIVAYNVLANGLLTGKFNSHTRFPKSDRRSRLSLFQGEKYQKALQEVSLLSRAAADQDLTLAQFAIKWALDQQHVSSVVLGIKSQKQILENCALYCSTPKPVVTGIFKPLFK